MKKLLMLLMAAILVGCVTYKDGEPVEDEAYEEQQEEKKAKEEEKAASEKEEKEPQDKEVDKEEDPKEQTIEINKEIELGNINIKLQNVYIEDDELSFGFWWNHWASNEKLHFSFLAYPVVSQNGEELEQHDDKDTLLKQTEKGVDSRVELKYDLQDDSPVEIKFKTTADDPEEENIEVDIN